MSLTEDFYFYPSVISKENTKEVGHVWRIKRTTGNRHNVYKPDGSWLAKFEWSFEAEKFIKPQMKENDVIAYN